MILTRAKPPSSLVDAFLESWVCWREACEDLQSAYERWGSCAAPQRRLAFASYRAALEREEQAARLYSFWTDRVSTRTSGASQ